MPQSKHEIQDILAQAGAQPLHRFGQNFMIDQNLVRIVADAGEITSGNKVIEVGPGTGTLTDELLARGANVTAVEIDHSLAAALRDRFASNPAFQLIEGDALAGKHQLNEQLNATLLAIGKHGRLKLVANLPYNIASPLVIDLLLAGVDLLAFTVQKEVADRLRARENSDKYGPLTVMVQLLGDVEYLRTLPPQAFWPQPKIESALVRIRRRDQLGHNAAAFSEFIHDLFSFRRKTLRKALTHADYPAEEILQLAKIDPAVRVETLSPLQLKALHEVAARAQKKHP